MFLMQEHGAGFSIPFSVAGLDLSITLPVMIMWGVSSFIFLFLLIANHSHSVKRVQFFIFDFISDAFAKSIHTKTKIWYSFLLTLFLFVFFNNLCGLFPGGESPTGNINVTAALAVAVFLISQISGFFVHGPTHVTHLIPSGIPKVMLVFFIPLELISLLAKPFSLAVRLFANMMAGHKVLLIFMGLGIASPALIKLLPFGGVVLISLFEMFVSFIQAFIFTYLASFYISDAVNGAH